MGEKYGVMGQRHTHSSLLKKAPLTASLNPPLSVPCKLWPTLTACHSNESKLLFLLMESIPLSPLALYQLCHAVRQRVKTQPHPDDLFKTPNQ